MFFCDNLYREIAWHDLAFHNADLYEGMRRMIVDTEQDKKDSEEFMATYCCYFEVSLPPSLKKIIVVSAGCLNVADPTFPFKNPLS